MAGRRRHLWNRVSADTIEFTHQRKYKIVITMSFPPDGREIHVVFANKDAGTTNTLDFKSRDAPFRAPVVNPFLFRVK